MAVCKYEISFLVFNFIRVHVSHSFAAPDQLAVYKPDRGVELGSIEELQLSDDSRTLIHSLWISSSVH